MRVAQWVAVAVVAAMPATGHAFNDPNWPCVQRKVLHLSVGQVWAGPLVPEDPKIWRDDAEIGPMVGTLAARRTPMGAVEAAVKEIGADADAPTREAKLLALFAGIFQQIDRERARIVGGIGRFAVKQRDLAAKIDEQQQVLAKMRAETAEDDFDGLDRIEEMEDALFWDTRIYEDRQRSLTYVCESPVLLEKRAFAIGRLIQSALEKS
ncbi:MAG: hypothetical protein AAGG06_07615 [Pseudomonadota bacterium]